MFRKFRVSERFMPKGGLSSFFYRIFDVSEYRKTSKTNPYVFHRFFCIERFYEKEGGGGKGESVMIFLQNLILSQYQIIS